MAQCQGDGISDNNPISSTTSQQNEVITRLLLALLKKLDDGASFGKSVSTEPSQSQPHRRILHSLSLKSSAALSSPEDATGDIERNTARFDGIEVYAVVSSLTLASSMACLDAFGQVGVSNTIFEVIFNTSFAIFNAIGIFTGLHATMIFSMVTMYGRTAIGLDRDFEMNKFLSKTGLQRYRAFKTFTWSLYCFLIQCAMTLVKLMVPLGSQGKTVVLALMACIIYMIIADQKVVVNEAAVIFDRRGHMSQEKDPKFASTRDLRGSIRDFVVSSVPSIPENSEEYEKEN
eukprot:CAMPEP_0197244794 /NCGR_PEP_ID=MMETSP1429-20130617/9805_1 /TAXON_ID=49237 /ORGANISM="Chaetoceros  sp., Strain UNC1202" /LENGTH=288 /DNA_ID=CAMNT_0042705205 /DNA_START=108 /DNA_END=974 /DNA_ORIENTATION=+